MKKDSSASRMELYDWLQSIVLTIVSVILFFVFIGRTEGIKGTSMLQTLQDADRVILSNLFYTPKNGDIIVFKTNAFEESLVKRVIATGGQTIDIDFKTGDVKVDGKVIHEKYINAPTHDPENFRGPITVPPGFIFVMGDNRNASTDSRSTMVGLVDTRQVVGKVLFILFPGKNQDGTVSWNRIGSVYK